MAVTLPNSSIGRHGATVGPAYQLFVKIGLGLDVVPAQAGTYNHRVSLFKVGVCQLV
jgi:hypothetical protein